MDTQDACRRCGGSGMEPDTVDVRVTDVRLNEDERHVLERHLLMRQRIFGAIDEILSQYRHEYVLTGRDLSDGQSDVLGWLATALDSRDVSGDDVRWCMARAAAALVWALESDGWPQRLDVVNRVRQERSTST